MLNDSNKASVLSYISPSELRIFEALPGNNVLVQLNPPHFTILGVTDSYLELTGKNRNQLLGTGIFEAFPANPDDDEDTGEKDLRFSFDEVIRTKKKHILPTQRYDISGIDGSFQERYWNASNTPIFDDEAEIKFVLHSVIEITEQVKVQKREKQIKLLEQAHNLFKQAPIAIAILTGKQLVIELANDPLITVWGKGSDIVGKPILEVLPEIESQGFVNLMHTVIKEEKAYYAYETPMTLKRNGKEDIVYFNFVYQPYYIREQAKPIGIIIFSNDITEQVKSKIKTLETEQRLRSLVESAPFPIGVYVGREMRIELANQAIIKIYGKGPDVIGKRYTDILPELDNQEIFKQLDGVYTSGLAYHAKNQRVDIEHEGKMQTYYFNYSFTPLFDAAGQVYGVMNTAADVTDLALAKKEVEETERILRSIILQAPVGISILRGKEYISEIANKHALMILGKSAEDLIGKPFFEVMPALEAQGIKQVFDEVFTSGKIFSATELPVTFIRNGNPDTGYFSISYEPLYDLTGKINGILSVGIEVTQQVLARQKIEEVVADRTQQLGEANEALSRSNDELKRSNTNLEEFAYAASHDLKEPIRKIHFYADRLRTSLANHISAEERLSFERMEKASRRMSSLIEDLLSYSQVSLKPRTFDEVDLDQLMDLVLNDLDLEIEQKGASIRLEKLGSIHGYHRQLQQAFQNLLLNSLKYIKPGRTPEIVITSRLVNGNDIPMHLAPEEAAKTFCLVEVKDNGIGFEQSDAERIFNVFTRLHGNVEYRGTGVGLSIVRKVIENHHGYIVAKGEPGQGAIFSIYFPEAPA